jgi:hypothetical protein
MENPRTTSARDHDDSSIIDAATDGPSFAGESGGNLQRDVASQAELDAIGDPSNHKRLQKQDAIDNDSAERSRRVPDD